MISSEDLQISINGIVLLPRDYSPAETFEALLLCIDFEHSPIDTIKTNLLSLLPLAKEYFIKRLVLSNDKQGRKGCSTVLKTIEVWMDNIFKLDPSQEQLIESYWDLRMRNEKKGLLYGFGVCKMDDQKTKLNVNPEKTLLRSLPGDS